MERINASEVRLTEAEQIVSEWFQTLLDSGFRPQEALEAILDQVPIHGPTWTLLSQQDFRDYLTGSNQPSPICGVEVVFGSIDRVSINCDLPPDHEGQHEGKDPLGVESLRTRWNGSGTKIKDITWVSKKAPA